MTFNRPVQITPHPGLDSVYFVVQQTGQILTVRRQGSAWAKSDTANIPVRRIGNGSNRQFNASNVFDGIHTGYYESRGLLGLALHPAFLHNGKYYVSYVTVRDTTGSLFREWSVIAERTASAATLRPATGDPERLILAVNQHPYWDHKGGTIRVGPDGMLYVAFGDGGGISPDDNYNRAQTRDVMLGKMLRIDPDGHDAFPADPDRNYAIPADNPFRDSAGYLPEIWAYGLRNPWKWGFHPGTGEIWLGDVGAGSREKLAIVPKGGNMGWKIWEGTTCRVTALCQDPEAGFIPPLFDMPRNLTLAGSITGGDFFMGHPSSAFHGVYVFGDYVTNRVWGLRRNGATVDTAQIATVTNVSSVDRDARGRLFVSSLGSNTTVSSNTGVIYILDSPDMIPESPARIADRRGVPLATFTLTDVLARPDRFVVTGLDGRRIFGVPSGVFVVRDRMRGTKMLMTGVK